MRRILGAIGRTLLLVSIWSCALLAVGQVIVQALEHQRLAARVEQLKSEYDQQVNDYADTLALGDKITLDQEYRLRLLKERFGYAEPDESPMVIIWDTAEK